MNPYREKEELLTFEKPSLFKFVINDLKNSQLYKDIKDIIFALGVLLLYTFIALLALLVFSVIMFLIIGHFPTSIYVVSVSVAFILFIKLSIGIGKIIYSSYKKYKEQND